MLACARESVESSRRPPECELDSGAGLHLLRAVDGTPSGHTRRYPSELAILVLIPYKGQVTLRVGDTPATAIDGEDRATWILNLERGATLTGAHDAAFSSIKITLSALERLATGQRVRVGGFPAMKSHPSDMVLESAVDALCEHVFATPGGQAADPDFCRAIGTAIEYHVLRTYGGIAPASRESSGALAAWQLKAVKEWILGNLDAKADAGDLAKMCGISTSHFRRAFFASTGVSLHRWIVRQRVEQVCGDLLGSGLAMADIALRWGFSDQSHLTRTFVAVLGMTPARWRRAQFTESHTSTYAAAVPLPLVFNAQAATA